MSKQNIVKGMIVKAKFERVLRKTGEQPKNVLLRLTHIIGQVNADDQLEMFNQPQAVVGTIIGKEYVGEFPLDNIAQRDEAMESLVAAEDSKVIGELAPVDLEVLEVETFGGRLHVKLSESKYQKRAARGGLKLGDVRKFKVKSLAGFGVFVAISEYEDALLHRNEQLPRQNLKVGDEVEAMVTEQLPDPRKGTKWGVSQLAIKRKAEEAATEQRKQREQAALQAEADRRLRQKTLVGSLKVATDDSEGTLGTAKVVRDRGDALVVVFNDTFDGVVPNDKLVFSKPSVATAGKTFQAEVVGVNLETGEVTLKGKPRKK